MRQSSCVNGPTSRNCWTSGFDIDTDNYLRWPTGRTRNFELTISNTTCNPDGHEARVCLLINNSLPGPTLIADWGDTLRITVRNEMQYNGTSIHWHGFRQLNSNTQDGVNGITECAIAPGDSKTYQFKATEYGTTWYHSHFSGQYGDGVVGTIIINGPATQNYDIDLGTYALSDWYYMTAFQAGAVAFNGGLGGAPPTSDNIIINGTNKNAQGGGAYNQVTLTPDKAHRLRIVNTALDSQLRVSLDNHTFTVIANDFVPVEPYRDVLATDYLQVGIGQRYDVIINANATSGNFWFRADAEPNCQSASNGVGRSIFTYEGTTLEDPTTTPQLNPPTSCQNPPSVPNIVKAVPSAQFASQAQDLPVGFGPVNSNGENVVLWTINGTSMIIDPGKPTLEYLYEGNTSYPSSYNIVQVSPTATVRWTYWVIQQAAGAPPIAHPIHLHGHDMYVLGTGSGQFADDDVANIATLNFANPPRRDVTFLPGGGWLVVAYPSDNPGAWLMHCHIAFHVSMGLSTQFLESPDKIVLPAANSEFFDTCANWNSYQQNSHPYPQDDSGLKKRWPPA
ncbi:multicopper oxidase [Pleomassaria siparia CBS 279.74]|uniref:laccase n=1 Tax=Pleomassaria siparia CBS 279.74 TaxID=1314801 RepID=A0A6G1JSF4_9PLEO|nr:multicopper oxidase [Pleomassaria siparia CBS 279.74]